jgi:EpsI family protein
MLKSSKKNYWILLAVLVVAGLFVNFFEHAGEVQAARKTLGEFPRTLGEWTQNGTDQRFDAETEGVLRADDYVMRNYAAPGRRANVYVGYYSSQRTGATYHSPLNCLPGSGWTLNKYQVIDIKTADGKTFQANSYLIESDKYKEVLIYWYQGRGRAVASEFQDKLYTVWDSVWARRSDGAMVRVMVPVGDSEGAEDKAMAAAADLASKTAESIGEYVPN